LTVTGVQTCALPISFDDVRFLLPLYEELTARLEKRDRLDWAREEFARLARITDPDEPVAEERWRKLKGVGSLDRRKLAVVRALRSEERRVGKEGSTL